MHFDPPSGGSANRSLLLWLQSPRQAALTVLRLRRMVPAAVVYLVSSEATGAEGAVAVACGRIPTADRPAVGRLLAGLDVAVLWDTRDAWLPAGRDRAAGR